MKNKFLTILLFLGFSAPVLAQDAELPDGGVKVDLVVVSNYIFRGADFHANAAAQDGVKQGSHTGAAAFQPSITLNMPVEGFTFNIWGNYALTHRADADEDKVLEQGPNGGDIYTGEYKFAHENVTTNFLYDVPRAQLDTLTKSYKSGAALANLKSQHSAGNVAGGGAAYAPGFYKELNGLKRADETDLTLGYSKETKVGTLGGGIVTYLNPYTATTFTELFISYGLPGVPVSVTTWGDDDFGSVVTKLAYSPVFELAEGTSVGLTIAATHQGLKDTGSTDGKFISGLSHYDLGGTFTTGGLTIGLAGAYRNDWRFYDGDFNYDPGVEPYLKLLGESSGDDGLVEDKSRRVGYGHSYVNTITSRVINSALNANSGNNDPILTGAGDVINYVYTPRQKLPRWVWYASIGYTVQM